MSIIYRFVRLTTLDRIYKCQTNKNLIAAQTFTSKTSKDGAATPSLFATYKKLFHHYWYMVIPIHLLTSAVWFGGCYYITKRGFNVLERLKTWGASEELVDFFKYSSLGSLTVTFALYKLLAPFRFTTTFFASSLIIRPLATAGLIKPIKNPFRRRKKE